MVMTMRVDDDSDMKIAPEDFDASDEPCNEKDSIEATAHLLEQEKRNGNLSRARRLGAIMAEDVSAIEGETTADDHFLMTQRRILLAFAVEVGLDAYLPNNLTAQTAQTIFYDTLHITAPTFYDDLQESGAFSFYFLCVRDGTHGIHEGKQVEKRVGETYASLCGKAGDASFARIGQELYVRFMEQVKHFTDVLEFVKE